MVVRSICRRRSHVCSDENSCIQAVLNSAHACPANELILQDPQARTWFIIRILCTRYGVRVCDIACVAQECGLRQGIAAD